MRRDVRLFVRLWVAGFVTLIAGMATAAGVTFTTKSESANEKTVRRVTIGVTPLTTTGATSGAAVGTTVLSKGGYVRWVGTRINYTLITASPINATCVVTDKDGFEPLVTHLTSFSNVTALNRILTANTVEALPRIPAGMLKASCTGLGTNDVGGPVDVMFDVIE